MRERQDLSSRLTGDETSSLQQISTMLRRDDPRLARLLTRRGNHRRTVDVATLAVGVLITAAIAIGILLRLPPVCAAGWTGFIGLTVLRAMYTDGA